VEDIQGQRDLAHAVPLGSIDDSQFLKNSQKVL
jgi:hypothetical protein